MTEVKDNVKEALDLKEALNTINIVGTLIEKNLETGITADAKKEEYIRGELEIQTDEYSTFTVSVYAKKLTSKGGDNKLYKGYETIKKKFNSLVDVKKLNEGKPVEEHVVADKVEVIGTIGINDYFHKEAKKLISNPQLNAKFIERYKETEERPFEPKASFDVEMVIQSITPEIKNEEETGRLKIVGIIPIYGGRIIPIDFIVTDEDGVADHVFSNFEKGNTVNVWGDLVNMAITKVKVKEGFGKSKEDVITTYRREFLIMSGNPEAYEEEKAYDIKTIAKALAIRADYLKDLENNKGNKSDNTPTKTKSFGKPKEVAKTSISVTDELPF